VWLCEVAHGLVGSGSGSGHGRVTPLAQPARTRSKINSAAALMPIKRYCRAVDARGDVNFA